MKLLSAILALFLSFNAFSGELDNVFSEGIFGTLWGQSSKEVKEIFPSGKKETSYGSTRIVVEDGREVLGIKRPSGGEITFAFDANDRLSNIGVTFGDEEDFAKLMAKLDTLFGEHSRNGVMIKWADEKTVLSLIYMSGMFSGETVLGIEHSGLQKNTKSKEELGF